MYGGGLITSALCSGGSTYTNENKTITANGEYTPTEGVRWDKVTVDVPQGGSIIDRITSLPAVQGGNIGNKYRYLIHYGNATGGTTVAINSYPANNHGGATKYYNRYVKEPTMAWFALYPNTDNKAIVVYALYNYLGSGYIIEPGNFYSKCYEYSTRATNGSISDGYEEYEEWLYCLHTAHLEGVEAGALNKENFYVSSLKFTFHFTVTDEYYVAYSNDPNSGEAYQTAPPGTVLRTDVKTYTPKITIYLPCAAVSLPSAFFSNLSYDKLSDEMVNLVYSLNEN